MKRILFLILLIIPSTIFAAPKELHKQVEQTKQIHVINPLLSTHEYTLPNGLKVFLTANPKAPNVVVQHWVKAGSLHETPGRTGMAHMFEHMMFRPLKPGAPSFFDLSTAMGGDFNASTKFESTVYSTSIASANLGKLLKIESDRFKNLVVTNDLLDVERKAVWSEYSVKFDANPVIDLWYQIYRQGFVGHPLGWHIIGLREDLDKLKADDCNAFFKSYYRPNNTGLFVTGNFDAKSTLKHIVDLYSDWTPGKQTELPPAYAVRTTEIVGEGNLPSEGKVILFGFRTPYLAKDNAKVQTLANYILLDVSNGLAKKRLVDDKKLLAEVSEFNFDYDNGMQKAGLVALPTSKIPKIKEEMALIAGDFQAMTASEFETYKMNLQVRMGEGILRNSNLSDLLGMTWGKYGNLDLTSELATKRIDVTKEQVQQFLAQYFVPDNFVFVTHKGQIN